MSGTSHLSNLTVEPRSQFDLDLKSSTCTRDDLDLVDLVLVVIIDHVSTDVVTYYS